MRLYRSFGFLALAVFFSSCHSKRIIGDTTTATTGGVAISSVQGVSTVTEITMQGQFTPHGNFSHFSVDSSVPAQLKITRTDYQKKDSSTTVAAATINHQAHWESAHAQPQNIMFKGFLILYIGLVLAIFILVIRLFSKS